MKREFFGHHPGIFPVNMLKKFHVKPYGIFLQQDFNLPPTAWIKSLPHGQ
ncbi:hypothetical protein [Zobellella taiwanensis]|nr:hypothetical protein [Zobellella taiwanensis]